VTYKSVPLICDSSSAICLAHNPVLHGRAKHIKVRHHFLRDHVEKGDIEIKFIDTERQLADIFTKPINSSHFASLWGRRELSVCHLYSLVWGGAYDLPYIFISFAFLLHFLHTHISHFASPVILACIWLILLITVLGWVVIRCATLLVGHAR
jgi:hypothetical protein